MARLELLSMLQNYVRSTHPPAEKVAAKTGGAVTIHVKNETKIAGPHAMAVGALGARLENLTIEVIAADATAIATNEGDRDKRVEEVTGETRKIVTEMAGGEAILHGIVAMTNDGIVATIVAGRMTIVEENKNTLN